MFSANQFKAAWLKKCREVVNEDDRYFLVDIELYLGSLKDSPSLYTYRTECVWNDLKKKGYRCIGPSNALSYKYICINANTKIFFSGAVGYHKLGIDYIGNKPIEYDIFLRLNI